MAATAFELEGPAACRSGEAVLGHVHPGRAYRTGRTVASPTACRLQHTAGSRRAARLVLLLAAIAAPLPAMAQPIVAAPAPIPFRSVAAALADLEARDGNGTIVTHADGWTIVNEPQAAAQWSFTPKGHAAYPAAVRRVIRRSPAGAVVVETSSLCEAPQAECDRLLAEFASMNDRITQAAKAKTRQPPAPAAR